jgi:hypothetical protein
MVKNTLPESVFNRIFENALNARFDHVAYSLKPKHHATAQHPTLNDDMPKRLANGMLKIKPDVKEFTVTGVIFEDNTRDDNIDFVCMAGKTYLKSSTLLFLTSIIDLSRKGKPNMYPVAIQTKSILSSLVLSNF